MGGLQAGIFFRAQVNLPEMNHFERKMTLALIRCYQLLIAPLLGNHCRFVPSCSAYAYEAIEKYGVFKGIRLGCQRLLRCHPFHQGGIDPVP